MVLEQLFGPSWLEKKPHIMFILGFIYAELGMISALVVFPENPSLIAIGFISLLLLPSLNSFLSMEENDEIRQKRFSLKQLFKDHIDIIKVYLALFIGILIAYALLAFILPASTTERLFSVQLNILDQGVRGNAIAGLATGLDYTVYSILVNNLKVLSIMFLLSLVYGAGSILFLTWNASVWGAIFGHVTKTSAFVVQNLKYFTITMVAVSPHLFLEAFAYFFAAIGGGVISKAVIREKINSQKFNHVVFDGCIFFVLSIIVLVLAAFVEVYVFPIIYCAFEPASFICRG